MLQRVGHCDITLRQDKSKEVILSRVQRGYCQQRVRRFLLPLRMIKVAQSPMGIFSASHWARLTMKRYMIYDLGTPFCYWGAKETRLGCVVVWCAKPGRMRLMFYALSSKDNMTWSWAQGEWDLSPLATHIGIPAVPWSYHIPFLSS